MAVSTIRHDIESRYNKLFLWIADFKKEALDKGYVELNDQKKFFSGLKSPNLEKRKKALELTIRWIIKY